MEGLRWSEGWDSGPLWKASIGPFRLSVWEHRGDGWQGILIDVEAHTAPGRMIFEQGNMTSKQEAKQSLTSALAEELQRRGWHIESFGSQTCIVRPERHTPGKGSEL